MVYICNFNFDGERKYVVSDNMENLKNGFWINLDLEYTNGEDIHYWIPAHQIMYIEKREDF